MLKIVYLYPRRKWAPTIAEINRASRDAARLRRALWGLSDVDARFISFEGNTLLDAIKRLARTGTDQ